MKLSTAFGAGIVVGAAGLAGGLVIPGPEKNDPVSLSPLFTTGSKVV